MAAQAHRLLIDGNVVGIDRSLGNDARLVNIGRGEHRLELLAQARLVGHSRLGGGRLHVCHQRLDTRELFLHVGAELRALALAHLVIVSERLLRQRDQAGADLILIRLRLLHGQDVRKAHERHERHVIFQVVAHGERIERVDIGAQQRLVHTQDGISRLRGIDRDEHIQLAAADVLLDGGFDRVLREEEIARHAHGNVQIAVVDALELHRDVQALNDALCAAVAGHTSYHWLTLLILGFPDLNDLKSNGAGFLLTLVDNIERHAERKKAKADQNTAALGPAERIADGIAQKQ